MTKDIKPDDSKPEAPETPESEETAESTPVDLSALQGFDFGTSWSKSTPSTGGTQTSDRRPRHSDRRPRGDQADRKDRRPFKPGSFRKPGRQEGDEQGGRPQRSFSGQGRRPMGRPDIPKKVIEASFYPEDNGFKALCKALRISTITYELFDIARTILEKEERFYMIIHPAESPVEGESEAASFYVVESDGLPFLSEDAAKRHALTDCLEHFFTSETTEVEAPTGSFSSIRKCGFTGELLGPPNFHRIKKIMADHHASKLSNLPFAKFESKIESVTEEEVIAEWLEKMKTQTTYSLKPEFGEPRVFEDGETARAFVKANLAEKSVKKTTSVRLEGTQIAKVKDPLLKANLEFTWDRQKRFPLDSANLLRGRLRRQRFSLYKKGSKGVSFVCAVKRRFRDPCQAFSDQVQKLIEFVETNPNTKVKELPEKFLGFAIHAPEGETVAELTEEQQKKLKAMSLDFQWLLKEGYIAEYSDGSIFSHPVASSGQGVVPSKTKSPIAKTSTKKESSETTATDSDAKTEEKSDESQPEKAVSEKPKKRKASKKESAKKPGTASADESEAINKQENSGDSDNSVEETTVETLSEETPASYVPKEAAVATESEEAITEAIDEAPVGEETAETKAEDPSDAEAVIKAVAAETEDVGVKDSPQDEVKPEPVDQVDEKEVIPELPPDVSETKPAEAKEESQVATADVEEPAEDSEKETSSSSENPGSGLKEPAKS